MIGIPVRSEDATLLRRLHDEHAEALWSYTVHLLGGDRAAAQDVVQETFLRAWQHPEALGQDSVRGWLFTVARHLVIDQRRRAQRRPELVTAQVPERDRSQKDLATALADRELLLAALRTLSVQHRAVLLECYFRGSSIAQAAARLDIAEGTVKSRTHYALRALRTALDELGWTP